MRLLDQDPIDPEIAATLDAIDATLAGEPVDARYAELAEIALLLASDRPQPAPEFARSMDERVERRFEASPKPGGPRRRRPLLRNPAVWQASGALMAGVALVVAVVVVTAGHLGSSAASSSGSFGGLNGASGVVSSSSASAPGTATSAGAASSAVASATSRSVSKSAANAAASAVTTSTPAPANSAAGASILQPPTSGRKVVQSAQLSLTADSNRIDAVSQEIYDVVGEVNGIVNNSSVTQGGPGGSANFELSIPSGSLAQTMSKLSQLTYAQVVSRTDGTQDITGQFDAATRALSDARALRTSLLKQLANATTTEQVNSLTAQIHDADASISSDEATLGRLNNQVNFSQVNVQINASTPPVPIAHQSGGFGIGRAAHDAGRVLTVAAGGALIAIAALTPVGLLVALVWWVGVAVRRRRREQALDSV
jgi:hypothetical protein